MATHEVSVSISSAIEIGNRDVVLPVKVDGKPFGKLKISRGTVDWIPSPNSKNGHRMTWERLAEVFEAHGREIK